MDLYELLKKRYSCRSYTTREVKWKQIYKILDAGRLAPSAGNLQSWRFIVVTNTETIKQVAGCCLRQLWINTAPVLIVVCSDNANTKRHFGIRGEFYSIQDCSAAIQNMLLMATELKLASCWVGAFAEDHLKDILEIPEGARPQAIITIGHPKDKPKTKKRYPVDLVTYYDEYGNDKRSLDVFPLEKQKDKIIEKTKKKKKGFFSRFKKDKSLPKDDSKSFNKN